jgi:hypothetical protein
MEPLETASPRGHTQVGLSFLKCGTERDAVVPALPEPEVRFVPEWVALHQQHRARVHGLNLCFTR